MKYNFVAPPFTKPMFNSSKHITITDANVLETRKIVKNIMCDVEQSVQSIIEFKKTEL